MSKENIIVGLEIGTSKVCVVVADARADGSLKVLGVGQTPARGVRKGEICDTAAAYKCVRDAIADAEQKSDVTIRSAYVGITGGHIVSFNNRGAVELPENRDEIDEGDLEEVKQNANEISIPEQNALLHTIIQHYYVDGQDGVLMPIGMLGHKLEADYHIVHGIRTRVQNAIRCVKEIPLEVEDVVINSLASAQVVVSQNQKNLGVLVIDMGGGTIDYLVYVDGAIKQSGVLPVGGDHITNDISMGLRIPVARAERLKVDEGSATLGNCLPGETIFLGPEPGFAGREIERETLNTIIHFRLRETFDLLKRQLDTEPYLRYLGAGAVLTGGCSLIHGINHLAEDVLGVPVQPAQPPILQGVTSALQNPQLSTALGLIKYAQIVQMEQPAPSFWARLKKWLFGGGRKNR
jgi:cell division protein FtsA